MTIQKNKRRLSGGTVKATGSVPQAVRAVCEGAFRNQAVLRLQKLQQQAVANRRIAAYYDTVGDAEQAAFWEGQAKACEQASQRPLVQVIDRTEAFYQRLRTLSPRQLRLKAEQQQHQANRQECISSLTGGLMLFFIVILFAIL